MGEEIYKAKFTADTKELTKAAKDAESKLSKFTSSVDKYSRKLVVAGAAITGAMVGIITKTVSAAASIEEMQNRTLVTFRQGTIAVQRWSAEFSEAVGRSRFAMEGLATQFGVLLSAFGLTNEEVVKHSIALGQLTTDWESFMNLPAADVIAKVSSGLAGEAEALRRLGVDVSAVAVKQELLNQGFQGSIESATQLQKVQARLAIILRGLPDAQGDAARTSRELTNQWRAMQGALEELQVELGKNFAPLAQDAISLMTKLIKGVRDFTRDQPLLVQRLGKTTLGIGATSFALGGMGLAIAKLAPLMRSLASHLSLVKVGFAAIGVAAIAAHQKIQGLHDELRNIGEIQDITSALIKRMAGAAKEMAGALREAEIKEFFQETSQAVNQLAGQLGPLETKLKSLAAFQAQLSAAQEGVASSALEVSREFAKMQATDAGAALLDYRFILEDIDKLWPEIATGSTAAMAEMSGMIQKIASLDVENLGEAWAVSTDEAREQLEQLATETAAATSDLIQMQQDVAEQMVDSTMDRVKTVGDEVAELATKLLNLEMDIDISKATAKLAEIGRQAAMLLGDVGVGSGTAGEDRLSVSRRPRHSGRKESITTNVNATINIARSGTPSGLAKSVAADIGRMKRRGQLVG